MGGERAQKAPVAVFLKERVKLAKYSETEFSDQGAFVRNEVGEIAERQFPSHLMETLYVVIANAGNFGVYGK